MTTAITFSRQNDAGSRARNTYCAFQKHANSKIQKPPSLIINNHNYDHKQWTLKHRNTQHGLKSTNHRSQTLTFWTRLSKALFPKRSVKIIDGSEKCKCQLVFELQSSRVYEKRSKGLYSTTKLTCGSSNTCFMLLIGPQGIPDPSNASAQSFVDLFSKLHRRNDKYYDAF